MKDMVSGPTGNMAYGMNANVRRSIPVSLVHANTTRTAASSGNVDPGLKSRRPLQNIQHGVDNVVQIPSSKGASAFSGSQHKQDKEDKPYSGAVPVKSNYF
jgi:hypothetical protein